MSTYLKKCVTSPGQETHMKDPQYPNLSEMKTTKQTVWITTHHPVYLPLLNPLWAYGIELCCTAIISNIRIICTKTHLSFENSQFFFFV